jgi:proteasome assembly chaperone (PAC2) family protein
VSNLEIEDRPQLNRPMLIAAWSGWNDAGESATGALRFMLRRWRTKAIAHIDPEPFYDFTQSRPRVRLEGGERVLDWPKNEFSPHKREGPDRDLVVMLGIEPHLAWNAYGDAVMEFCRSFEVDTVLTLGALLAEASHARPINVTGSSEDPELREQLGLPEPRAQGYEGPTGIVGVLNNRLRDAGLKTASMWANVPHYVNASPNPKGALALLEQLNSSLHLELSLHDLEVFAARFDAQVGAEIAKNPEMVDYARRIEEQEDADAAEAEADAPPPELPDAADMVDELERFLREQRDSG